MFTAIKTVGEMGEFALIDRLQRILPKNLGETVIHGVGDDTAVIGIDDHRALLITCDIQVEDRHFRLKYISPYQLGQRAMAVNLSDIAAMGGTPTYALVSLGLPNSFPLNAYDQLFEGMKDELSIYSSAIVGGNLARTEDKLIIDITLLGEISRNQVITRSGAQEGDRIFVTGTLGASGAGFYILENIGRNYPPAYEHLVKAHLHPTPRIKIGHEIARAGFATAMIDISDGLAGDLYHICTRSDVGAVIDQLRLPLPEHIEQIESLSGMSSIQMVLHSGEDYELLFTVASDTPIEEIEAIGNEFRIPIREIGRIIPKNEGYYLVDAREKQIPIHPRGWDHFEESVANDGGNKG